MNELERLIRKLLAIEMLEYEEKKHLMGNDTTHHKNKTDLLVLALKKIQEMK